MRAPVSRSRPPSSVRLPASRGPSACRRPRLARRACARASRIACLVAQMPVGLPFAWGAGADLEQPELLGGQRGLLVGVVLVAGEQEPEQARELARGGDDRDRWPRRARIALIEGVHAGRVGERRSRPPRPAPSAPRRSPALRCVRRRRRRSARLADLRVKTQVADQLAAGLRTARCHRPRP